MKKRRWQRCHVVPDTFLSAGPIFFNHFMEISAADINLYIVYKYI